MKNLNDKAEQQSQFERLIQARDAYEKLVDKKIGPKLISEGTGIKINTVKGHFQGRNGFGTDDAKSYAKFFGVSTRWLVLNEGRIGDAYNDDDNISEDDWLIYVGRVSAGSYQATDALHVSDSPRRIPMQPDPRYLLAQQFAWEVEGDSMNEMNILEGMWAIGAVAEDFKRHYGDIPSGSVVIAQRNRFGGAEYEVTIKQVRFYQDRFELVPRSSNTEYKIWSVEYATSADKDDMEVTIMAIVLGVYGQFGASW